VRMHRWQFEAERVNTVEDDAHGLRILQK